MPTRKTITKSSTKNKKRNASGDVQSSQAKRIKATSTKSNFKMTTRSKKGPIVQPVSPSKKRKRAANKAAAAAAAVSKKKVKTNSGTRHQHASSPKKSSPKKKKNMKSPKKKSPKKKKGPPEPGNERRGKKWISDEIAKICNMACGSGFFSVTGRTLAQHTTGLYKMKNPLGAGAAGKTNSYWDSIAERIPGRSGTACKSYFNDVLISNAKKYITKKQAFVRNNLLIYSHSIDANPNMIEPAQPDGEFCCCCFMLPLFINLNFSLSLSATHTHTHLLTDTTTTTAARLEHWFEYH